MTDRIEEIKRKLEQPRTIGEAISLVAQDIPYLLAELTKAQDENKRLRENQVSLKAPKQVIFKFDPIESNVKSFGNEIAKIIYCCIRKNHIVDQHFDEQAFAFGKRLSENMPAYYLGFKRQIERSPFSKFGIRTISETSFSHEKILDDNFWIGVWEYIKDWHSHRMFELDIVIDIPTQALTKEQPSKENE
ncbi:MAG: hypothetical protein KAS32_04595 [Candidatus Peribacteraceae bacterium]|nr:hypothetical protein [Candidatus Peribacteraceae bacterium]